MTYEMSWPRGACGFHIHPDVPDQFANYIALEGKYGILNWHEVSEEIPVLGYTR